MWLLRAFGFVSLVFRSRAGGRLLALSVFLTALAGVLPSSWPAGAQARVDLTLTLTPSSYTVEARAGKNTRLSLEVRNTGTEALTGVSLTSQRPEGWMVTLDPSQIASISVGETRTVDVVIRPAPTVARGDYSVTLIASAAGIQRMQYVQVRVKPASYWVWVAFAVAAVIVAVFALVFVKAGKRKK